MPQLVSFQVEIKYGPGRININADVLSRLPEEQQMTLESEVRVVLTCSRDEDEEGRQLSWGLDPGRWQREQGQEPALVRVTEYVDRGMPSTAMERKREAPTCLAWLQQ